MQICLIRHGMTAGNRQRRYVGITDEELTEEAARELCAARAQYPAPDCVFASPMKRCVQTAQLLFPGLQPELSSGLRECSFGAFEYGNYQELQGDSRYQEWIDSGGTLAFPGGESRAEFSDRCCVAFADCCERASARGAASAAFVVHGGTIMAILDRYSKPHRDYFDWQAPNAGGFLCELESEGGERIPSSLRVLSVLPFAAEAGR